MRWLYHYLFPALWITFMIYWRIASAGTKSTRRVEAVWMRAVRVVLFAIAIFILTIGPLPIAWLYRPLYPYHLIYYWGGALVAVAGLLFAVWARAHLGGNWSRSVTLKEDHELITSGPYRWVRHPIYTGILTGFVGTMIALGQVRGVVAFLLVAIALCLKWRLEEKWMREEFGESYVDYSRRVPAVIPWRL